MHNMKILIKQVLTEEENMNEFILTAVAIKISDFL